MPNRCRLDAHFFDGLGCGLHGHDPLLRPGPQTYRPAFVHTAQRTCNAYSDFLVRGDHLMGNAHIVLAADPADYLTTPTTCERLFAEVLADIVGAENVSVDSNFFDDLGADSMLMARFCARVRKRTDLPSVSMPDIYKQPTIRMLAAVLATDAAEPTDNRTIPTTCERLFAEVLADIVGTEQVSVDDHFFDDLGADSMLMARFCARVRKQPDLPAVSMPDIYQHPTIRSLSAALTHGVPTAVPAGNRTTPADGERRFADVLADIRGHRPRVGRRPLLRRPRRRLHAHGPLLRPRAQTARPARRCRCPTSTSTRRSAALPAALTHGVPTAVPAGNTGPLPLDASDASRTCWPTSSAPTRVGRRPLLRRPRRRLHAHGPLLRPRAQTARPASVSMPDIYEHPTIRSLAAALTGTGNGSKPAPVSSRRLQRPVRAAEARRAG